MRNIEREMRCYFGGGGGGQVSPPVGPPVPPAPAQAAKNVLEGKKKQAIGFNQTLLGDPDKQKEPKTLLGD